jgi:uncharacterized membrane protein
MLDIVYRRRIARDLPGWVARGWVAPERADALLASIPGGDLRNRLPAIVAVFGAILLALGAMSFVAANWNGISRLLRLALLFGALWGAYGGAVWLKSRGWSVLYEAAVILGCGIFGANIMLIAQMYHIDRHYPDGIMIWGLGTLLTAGLSRSVGAVVFGFGLLALWTAIESTEFTWPVHWPFLVAWFAAAWLVWYERWTLGINAAALALSAWAIFSIMALDNHLGWPGSGAQMAVLAACSVAAMALAIRFEAKLERRDATVWRMFSTQALIGLFIVMFAVQVAFGSDLSLVPSGQSGHWLIGRLDTLLPIATAILAVAAVAGSVTGAAVARRDAAVLVATVAVTLACALLGLSGPPAIAILATAYFGLAVWAINLGQRRDHRAAINLGVAAFGVEALYVYFRTIGSLLDTALFFLAGGGVLVLMAVLLERLRRRLVGGDGAALREQSP